MKREHKYLDPSVYISWIFRKTLSHLPRYRNYAPGIKDIGDSNFAVKEAIKATVDYRRSIGSCTSFLDFGARDGARKIFSEGCVYSGADIDPRGEGIIQADICHAPHIVDDSYDIVFSFDVFEHVERPWDAANECIRIAKRGGLIVCRTLFAYRYHPEPNDYWRFSSQCLEYLFTNSGQTETLISGYDIRDRRRNRKGVFLDHRPPIDWLGGWRENWQVLWIGRKL